MGGCIENLNAESSYGKRINDLYYNKVGVLLIY